MEKLVYVIWDRPSLEGGELRVRYSGTVVPELLGAGARKVSLHLDDDLAPGGSVSKILEGERAVGEGVGRVDEGCHVAPFGEVEHIRHLHSECAGVAGE